MPGTAFFSWPGPFVNEFLGIEKQEVLFIPYAAVTFSQDEYTSIVQKAFGNLGYSLKSIHQQDSPQNAVKQASVIVIGGGNSFVLLDRLYQNGLIDLIREHVRQNKPYIGWSAGANMACPTLMTTNDMPIVCPPSFDALRLVPFQINPHYTDFKPPGHGGETRQQRIEEFLVMNSKRKVIGLPEGMLLHREGKDLTLKGTGTAKLFEYGKEVEQLDPGTDLRFLLTDSSIS